MTDPKELPLNIRRLLGDARILEVVSEIQNTFALGLDDIESSLVKALSEIRHCEMQMIMDQWIGSMNKEEEKKPDYAKGVMIGAPERKESTDA